MIQTEAERQFYLGMSGIRMWYARDPLPGAAPSPDYDFGVQEPEAVAVPEVPVIPAAPRARRADPEQASRNRDKIARKVYLICGYNKPSGPKFICDPFRVEILNFGYSFNFITDFATPCNLQLCRHFENSNKKKTKQTKLKKQERQNNNKNKVKTKIVLLL